MSKKSCLLVYSKYTWTIGEDFLDTQYNFKIFKDNEYVFHRDFVLY